MHENHQKLIDIFLDRNSKINLSAIRNPEDVYQKHIVDSLEITKFANDLFKDNAQILDLGTGGGFPLLPLAMHFESCIFTGLDARKKKINAVQSMIEELGLVNASTIWSRAEDHKKQYDVVMARAVAYAPQLFERALPRVKKGGVLIIWKMHTIEEQADIREGCIRFNLSILHEHHYILPTDQTKTQRVIYVIKK